MTHFSFTNSYLQLGEAFYERRKPTPVENPGLIRFNSDLATQLGFDKPLEDQYLADIFSGNRLHDSCQPIAMAYAGHQFGHFNPQLGDGRAIYLGELGDESRALGIQLKGSGQTRYSRNGDGRAALGPVLREYLVSEAMFRLGVPTTRALAAVTTGEPVARERLLPGGVITRAARSFVRVGSFQFFAMQDDYDAVKQLADYVIKQNYPEASEADNPYLALLEAVVLKQAELIARWMQLGFIHGVMNTDNMSIAGETIDYGPCAFMDFYNHTQVYSSIDRQGRYAYSNQPSIGLWNLSRLAETMLPFFDDNQDAAIDKAKSVLDRYIDHYGHCWLYGMQAKVGLSANAGVSLEDDKQLIEDLFDRMAKERADFTLVFHYLSQLDKTANENDQQLIDLFESRETCDEWLSRWRQRLDKEAQSDEDRKASMRLVNPVFIPRNHQIEAVIRAAEDHNDFEPFHQLHDVLERPYELQPGKESYMLPPQPDEVVSQTFCGT